MSQPTPVDGTPALWIAVLEAQRSLRAVTKDKTAKVQTKGGASYEYKFASTEDVMAAAREALLAQGVIAQRLGFEIREGAAGAEVLSTFRLVHPESGQIEVYPPVPMPISGQGAADKVLAGALTYSWSYWLRDVLAIPREDAHDPDRRATDDGASRFGHGPGPSRKSTPRRNEPAPEPDRLWMAYETARAKAAEHLHITEGQAHQRILHLAEIHHDREQTDPEVKRMIDVAEALLLTDREPLTPGPDRERAVVKGEQDVPAPKAKRAPPKNAGDAGPNETPAIVATRVSFQSAYKHYQEECRAQGEKPRPWKDLGSEAIGRPWPDQPGTDEYLKAASACELEIDRMRNGGAAA